MPSAQANALVARLERHKTLFDADVVGDDVLDIVADEQRRVFEQQTDKDGNLWPPLSERYAIDKARIAPGAQMGHLYETMATEENFRGMRHIGKTEARMTFATSEEAREEARDFNDGDPSRNRPPRGMLGISDIAGQLVASFLMKHHRDSV